MKATVYVHDLDGDLSAWVDPNKKAVLSTGYDHEQGEKLTGFYWDEKPTDREPEVHLFLSVTVLRGNGTTISWWASIAKTEAGNLNFWLGDNWLTGEQEPPTIHGLLPSPGKVQEAAKEAEDALQEAVELLRKAMAS